MPPDDSRCAKKMVEQLALLTPDPAKALKRVHSNWDHAWGGQKGTTGFHRDYLDLLEDSRQARPAPDFTEAEKFTALALKSLASTILEALAPAGRKLLNLSHRDKLIGDICLALTTNEDVELGVVELIERLQQGNILPPNVLVGQVAELLAKVKQQNGA